MNTLRVGIMVVLLLCIPNGVSASQDEDAGDYYYQQKSYVKALSFYNVVFSNAGSGRKGGITYKIAKCEIRLKNYESYYYRDRHCEYNTIKGIVYSETNMHEEAIKYLTQATWAIRVTTPPSLNPYYNLGLEYYYSNQFQLAYESFRKALLRQPGDKEIEEWCAKSYQKKSLTQ